MQKQNIALIVDYGGVLGNNHQEPAESNLAELLGVDVEICRNLVSEKSKQGAAFREDKISEIEFWDSVIELSGGELKGKAPYKLLSKLWAETYALNKNVLGMLRMVRKNTPIGILSNIDRSRSDYLINIVGILDEVDIYLPSYRFRTIKPKAELWNMSNIEIKKKYGEDVHVIYVDDREKHINASQKFGWEGILFTGEENLYSSLNNLGLVY